MPCPRFTEIFPRSCFVSRALVSSFTVEMISFLSIGGTGECPVWSGEFEIFWRLDFFFFFRERSSLSLCCFCRFSVLDACSGSPEGVSLSLRFCFFFFFFGEDDMKLSESSSFHLCSLGLSFTGGDEVRYVSIFL